jgi:hypothetical protein
MCDDLFHGPAPVEAQQPSVGQLLAAGVMGPSHGSATAWEAVVKMIGVRLPSAINWLCSPTPLRPGICTSEITHSVSFWLVRLQKIFGRCKSDGAVTKRPQETFGRFAHCLARALGDAGAPLTLLVPIVPRSASGPTRSSPAWNLCPVIPAWPAASPSKNAAIHDKFAQAGSIFGRHLERLTSRRFLRAFTRRQDQVHGRTSAVALPLESTAELLGEAFDQPSAEPGIGASRIGPFAVVRDHQTKLPRRPL